MLGSALELAGLLRNRRLSADGLTRLQTAKIRGIVRHACEHVPYYRDLFRDAGLAPEDIRSPADLRRVPISDRQVFRDAGADRTIARGIERSSLRPVLTTGTTGVPFPVYLTEAESRTRNLLQLRGVLGTGLRPGDRLVYLGPHRPRRRRARHELRPFRSDTVPPHLSPEEQAACVRELRPTVLWAYPSSLEAVLHAIGYRWEDFVRPRILITSAEALGHGLRDRLLSELDAELFDFYGAVEVGRVAAECRAHEGLHVNADHVVVECLDPVGRPMTGTAGGSIVVTTLNAFAMPFIRYRLGDACTLADRRCSCGSPFPLIERIDGRESDLVRLASRRRIPAMWLSLVVREFDGIDQFRFIQESPDRMTVQLAVRGSLPDATIGEMRSRLLARIGEPMRLDFEVRDRLLPEGPKFRMFISRCGGNVLRPRNG